MTSFFVPGLPAPQGSKSFKGMRGGKAILVESSKAVKPWRGAVAAVAGTFSAPHPKQVPVEVTVEFVMPRPKAVSASKPTPAAVKQPDLDKLARAVLDALTGHAYEDDSQVTALHVRKRVAEPGELTGALIRYRPAVHPAPV